MDALLRRVGERARELVIHRAMPLGDAVAKTIDEVAQFQEVRNEDDLQKSSLANLGGFGALEPFLLDPGVEELWMNEPNRLFVSKNGVVDCHQIDLGSEDQQVIIERMLRDVGRRMDRSAPFVDASLRDGSRLHAVMPDVTRRHLSFNVRRYVASEATLESLEKAGSLTIRQREVLQSALDSDQTIFVSGATAAGKTTLLCAMLRGLPSGQRVVSVEDTFEIAIENLDWVAMQTRPDSVEGAGEIDLRRLIREALRMRPGRLVVGEVRGAEAVELLVALNSGIPALGTVHANSAEHAITKLMTLPLLSGVKVPIDFIKLVIGSSVALIAHCAVDNQGFRKVQELVRVSFHKGELVFQDA